MKLKIFMVDDDVWKKDTYMRLLQDEHEVSFFEDENEFEDAISSLINEKEELPDIVFMDIEMSGEDTGLLLADDLLKRSAKYYNDCLSEAMKNLPSGCTPKDIDEIRKNMAVKCSTKIIITSEHYRADFIRRSKEIGVSGYFAISKNNSGSFLWIKNAVAAVYFGLYVYSKKINDNLQVKGDTLNPDNEEVLEALKNIPEGLEIIKLLASGIPQQSNNNKDIDSILYRNRRRPRHLPDIKNRVRSIGRIVLNSDSGNALKIVVQAIKMGLIEPNDIEIDY